MKSGSHGITPMADMKWQSPGLMTSCHCIVTGRVPKTDSTPLRNTFIEGQMLPRNTAK